MDVSFVYSSTWWLCRQPISQIPVANSSRGVCVDLNGFVYVSCGWSGSGSHVVQIFDPRHNYSLLQTLGGVEGDAAGQFNVPTGMCVHHKKYRPDFTT